MNTLNSKRLKRTVVSLLVALIIFVAGQQGMFTDTKNSSQNLIEQNTPGLYSVARFDDGDTIVVNMEGKEEKIRFIGVDTPETQDPRKPVQCFGKAASKFTKTTIGNNRVRLEADTTNANRDRYQRLLRYVYLPDGTLINKKIIEEGYGFALTSFPFTKMEEFKEAQISARENNKGLWSKCEVDESKDYNQTKPQ